MKCVSIIQEDNVQKNFDKQNKVRKENISHNHLDVDLFLFLRRSMSENAEIYFKRNTKGFIKSQFIYFISGRK